MKTLYLIEPYRGCLDVEPIIQLAPKIALEWEVLRDITHFLNASLEIKLEFSWIGKVKKCNFDDQDVYLISEIHLLPQRATSGHTTLDPVAVGQIATQWIDSDGHNTLGFWGHTHPGFGLTPSPTDDQQMEGMIRGKFTPPFFIRGIFGTPPAGGPHFGLSYDAAPPRQADFSLYDFARGVKFMHVPWYVLDEAKSTHLDAVMQQNITVRVPYAPIDSPGSASAMTAPASPDTSAYTEKITIGENRHATESFLGGHS